MTKQEIIDKIAELNLPENAYIVFGAADKWRLLLGEYLAKQSNTIFNHT